MTIARSGHGAKVYRATAALPTQFVEIAEIGDTNLPGLMRNVFDATTQNRNIDARIAGVLRRSPFTTTLNFLDDDSTHNHLTGILAAIITEPPPTDGWKFLFPVTGTIWIASGITTKFDVKLPVDGKISADIAVEFSGPMLINGIVIGA